MSEPAKPRRWGRRIGIALALLTVCGAAWFAWTRFSTRNAIDAAYAELDATDPGWRHEQILASRKLVRDEDNSALVITAAAAAFRAQMSIRSPALEEAEPDWQLPKPWPPKLRDLATPPLAALPPKALQSVRSLKDLPAGRFKLKIDPTFVETLVSHLERVDLAMSLMEFDAYLRAEEESLDAALESCRALLNIARAPAGEPFIISHLYRCKGHRHLACAVERILAQGEATPESLRRLQSEVEREIGESEILTSLRAERACGIECLEYLEREKKSHRFFQRMLVDQSPNVPPNRVRDRILEHVPHRTAPYIVDHLRVTTRIVEAAKLPLHEQAAALKPIVAEIKDRQMPTVTLLMTNSEKHFRMHRASQTRLRALAVALACERYRVQHKAWPASLESLVDAKLLGAVPLDPNDGKPLRFRRTEWGIVVYGVADDRTDDEGNILHEWNEPLGTDLGIRLWDVPRRKGGVP